MALQSEQIQELVRSDPQRAEEELARTQALARHALSEVRAVSAGYRVLSPEREAGAAAGQLESLGVAADVELAGCPLPRPVDETPAIVVREGVTNALRHSRTRRCAIRLTADRGRADGGWARLEVSDDGAAPGDEPTGSRLVTGPGGSGLRNLRERVAERGGVLTAEADGEGGFRLVVALPCASRDTVTGGAPERVLARVEVDRCPAGCGPDVRSGWPTTVTRRPSPGPRAWPRRSAKPADRRG